MSIISTYKKELAIFEERLLVSKSIAIVHHYNPDGDAIGSSLGLYNTLIQTGKKVIVISPSIYPDYLKWLPESKKVIVIGKKMQEKELFIGVDMIISLDFNALSRVYNIQNQLESSSAFKVLFDHHPGPEKFADITISSVLYSSTAELIYEVIANTYLKEYLNESIATCLYTGILTDTGAFEYNSSNPNLFITVSNLLKFGLDKNKIYNNLFNAWSVNRIRFMGFVMLNRMVVLQDLKTAYIYITVADRHRFNEQFGDTENFVNIPMQIEGIVFTAIFIERDNFIKASFRSKGTFDVNSFSAKHFNGGGHINASGGEFNNTLEKTCTYFENIVKTEYADYLKEYIY